MNAGEQPYLDLLRSVLAKGDRRVDRTGVGTLSIFGYQMRFDLNQGVPLLTTKKVFWKLAAKEALWFLTASTNIRPLVQQGVSIWSDWPLQTYRKATGEQITKKEFERRILEIPGFAEKWGELGPVYGKQWRRWESRDGRVIDQIAELLHAIKTNPTGRRLLFTGWNVGDLEQMALPPCHMTYQFYVAADRLSCQLYQRSADCFLGVPWNLFEAALFTHLFAQQCDLGVGELIWTGGDCHLYLNHLEQARLQLSREPRPFPRLELLRRPPTIDDYQLADFQVAGYDPHPPISGEIAV